MNKSMRPFHYTFFLQEKQIVLKQTLHYLKNVPFPAPVKVCQERQERYTLPTAFYNATNAWSKAI